MTTTPAVITIDGAAGSGKSTLGRGLAVALRLPYVNTGLMYRHLTYEALRTGTGTDDGPSLIRLLREIHFSLSDGYPPELLIQGLPTTRALQTPRVEAEVSNVARHPEVREFMRAEQRALGELHGAVMDGRDIGSVVFPDAPLKLYLTADAGARVARRADERTSTQAEVEALLHTRDQKDARVNPPEAPLGSTVLDTASLGVRETLRAALELVRVYAPELIP
jgi:cytidylate kinase